MPKNMKTRKGKDGFNYPYTSPDLVIDPSGKSVTTKFNELEDKMKKVGSTSIDDTNTTTDKTWSSSKIDSQFKDIANNFTTEQTDSSFIIKYGNKIIAEIPLNTTPSVYGNIVVDVTSLEITEGGTGTFTVKLDQAPTKNQVISVTSSNEKVTVNPSILTFTPSNYNTTQTVTISAKDDNVEDNGYTLTLTLSSDKVTDVVINVTVKDDDLIIDWHTLTSDEVSGINATNYLLSKYSGTNNSISVPNILNDKNVEMNAAANVSFDANGVIENLKFGDNVTGSFIQSGSYLPKLKKIEGIGKLNNLSFNASNTLTKVSIITENNKCIALNLPNNTNLIEINGLEKLTALTSNISFSGNTSLESISGYPPNLSNSKLMFWKCTSLKNVPPINIELTEWNNMFLECSALKELTVTAMKGCDLSLIGNTWSGDKFTFKCNYNSDMYKAYRNTICNSKDSREEIFIEILNSNDNPITDIVMWGDSMTKAGNNTMGNMPDQLATMTTNDVMIYNYGGSGNTIQTAGTRFKKHPETYNKTSVIWLGTNNVSISGEEMCSLIQSTFLDKLTTDKYIIVGLLTTNYTDEKNQAFISAFGNKFLNIREYFINNMWAISGLSATDQDNTDLSNNLIPSSFRVDQTHLNPTGGKIVATAIKEKLLSLGYIKSTQIV